MTTPGADNPTEEERILEEVAESTVGTLMRSVPKELVVLYSYLVVFLKKQHLFILNAMQKVDRSAHLRREESGIYHSSLVVLYNTLLLKHGVVRILKQVKQHYLLLIQANSEATRIVSYVAGSQPSSDEHFVAG